MKLACTSLVMMTFFSTSVVAQTKPYIPHEFRGEWNMRTADCGTALNDSVIQLNSDKIRYYESFGPVRAVLKRGREIPLLAELSGEGEPTCTSPGFAFQVTVGP